MPIVLLFVLAAFVPSTALAGPEGWKFIQSTGGMIVEAPIRDARGWALPLRVDVAGAGAGNSAAAAPSLTCERVDVAIERDAIHLTVVTGPARPSGRSRCPAASLGDIAAGKYRVHYRGPGEAAVPVGEVFIRM